MGSFFLFEYVIRSGLLGSRFTLRLFLNRTTPAMNLLVQVHLVHCWCGGLVDGNASHHKPPAYGRRDRHKSYEHHLSSRCPVPGLLLRCTMLHIQKCLRCCVFVNSCLCTAYHSAHAIFSRSQSATDYALAPAGTFFVLLKAMQDICQHLYKVHMLEDGFDRVLINMALTLASIILISTGLFQIIERESANSKYHLVLQLTSLNSMLAFYMLYA